MESHLLLPAWVNRAPSPGESRGEGPRRACPGRVCLGLVPSIPGIPHLAPLPLSISAPRSGRAAWSGLGSRWEQKCWILCLEQHFSQRPGVAVTWNCTGKSRAQAGESWAVPDTPPRQRVKFLGISSPCPPLRALYRDCSLGQKRVPCTESSPSSCLHRACAVSSLPALYLIECRQPRQG